MKSLVCTFGFVLAITSWAQLSHAQTNTFPSSGNVGVGTTSPGAKLEVNGGSLAVKSSTSTFGSMALNPGDSGYAGYIDWYRNGPTRLAYMGFQDLAGSQNNLGLNLENGANFVIGGGNVGIGTGSPFGKLHVVANATTTPIFTLSSVENGGDGWLEAIGPYTNVSASSNGAHHISWGAYYNGSLNSWVRSYNGLPLVNLQLTTSGDFVVETEPNTTGTPSWQTRLFVREDGNIGIGTTNPQAKLDVLGTLQVTGNVTQQWGDYANYVQYPSAYAANPTYFMGWKTDTPTRRLFVDNRNSDVSSPDPNGGITFRTGDAPTERMHISYGGNVGIGTTNPTQKLSVNGTIRAKEVIVEASPWPDDVFAPGYDLPTVDQVAAHIEAEGHLPGVPSAATVAEQGVAVGEMQKTLLRKVEELTLYVIELKRENAALQRQFEDENAALRAEQREEIRKLRADFAALSGTSL